MDSPPPSPPRGRGADTIISFVEHAPQTDVCHNTDVFVCCLDRLLRRVANFRIEMTAEDSDLLSGTHLMELASDIEDFALLIPPSLNRHAMRRLPMRARVKLAMLDVHTRYTPTDSGTEPVRSFLWGKHAIRYCGRLVCALDGLHSAAVALGYFNPSTYALSRVDEIECVVARLANSCRIWGWVVANSATDLMRSLDRRFSRKTRNLLDGAGLAVPALGHDVTRSYEMWFDHIATSHYEECDRKFVVPSTDTPWFCERIERACKTAASRALRNTAVSWDLFEVRSTQHIRVLLFDALVEEGTSHPGCIEEDVDMNADTPQLSPPPITLSPSEDFDF